MYHAETNDIAVSVRPVYAPDHSDQTRFVFVYHIRIENRGERTVQLLWRHWYIHDDVAGDSEVEVEGEGVIGEQPILAPGDYHEYESYCVLRGPSGHMEGFYEFKRTSDGVKLRVDIPRFLLGPNLEK